MDESEGGGGFLAWCWRDLIRTHSAVSQLARYPFACLSNLAMPFSTRMPWSPRAAQQAAVTLTAGERIVLPEANPSRMNGKEVVRRLKGIRPDIRAAYMTGYAEYATSGSETSSNQQDSILQKPFSSTSLADMIRAVLAGKASEKASDAKECRVL